MTLPTPTQNRLKYLPHGAILFLAFVFLYLLFLAGHFSNLADPDAMDYAQVARRLATGRGFTTNFLRPFSLVRFPNVGEHPDMLHPPLHIAVTALVMRALAPDARAAALASGIPYLLTLPLVFALGYVMFGLRTGLLAAVLVGTNLECLGFAISGLETPLGTLLATALFLTLLAVARSSRYRIALVAGAGGLCAGLYLSNYLWLAFLPPALGYLLLTTARGQRWKLTGVMVMCFVVVCAPWWARNWVIARNPFFTLASMRAVMDTRSHPGNTLFRRCDGERLSYPAYALSRPREIVVKARGAAQALYPALPSLMGVWLMPFAIAAVLVRLGKREQELLRVSVYVGFLLLCVGLTIVTAIPRLLMPFAPVLTVIAAAYFLQLLDARVEAVEPRRKAFWTWLGISALLGLHWFPLYMSLGTDTSVAAEETAPERVASDLGGLIDGPVVTDVPWLVAWVTDRPAIWLPLTMTDLAKLQTIIGPVRWLLMTPNVVTSADSERTRDWASYWGRARVVDLQLGDFLTYKRLAGGDWVLFRRGGLPQPADSRQ